MIIRFFRGLKRIVLSSVLIYSLNVFISSLGISIPINFVTLFFVSIFDVSALFYLILFSVLFY